MKTITGEKVIKALLEGKKVRHWTGNENDYIYYENGHIYDQDGEIKYELGLFLYSIANTKWYLLN